MIAIFDFIPAYCPNCGMHWNLTEDDLQDFENGQPFTCDCGLTFQKADQAEGG
jgi:hypothetical protein